MDYEERVVKLEVNMDTLKEELTLLRAQIAALDRKVEEFREQTYRKLDESREQTTRQVEQTNRRIDELREHTDRHIDELREQTTRQIEGARIHSDKQFEQIRAELMQIRREHIRLIYWVAGLTFTNLLTIIGLLLKATGVF